jgi:hypothetical protein
MPHCLIPNCTNNAEHNLGIRCRRPNTTAIWAPNCDAYLCDDHADQGFIIDITLTPNDSGLITTNVSAGGSPASRTTPINHGSIE